MSLDIELVDDVCPHCGRGGMVLFELNITHNLNDMADAVGIYEFMWHPASVGVKQARDLIAPLRKGLAVLEGSPEKFEKYNAAPGCGTYEQFLEQLREYLIACWQFPSASVVVCV